MTCKHPARERQTYGYANRGIVSEHTECLVCGEVMPIGPANDTAEVMQEIEAAELVALIAPGANPLFASVRMPTALKRAAFRGDPFDEQFIVRLIEQGSMATPTIVWAYEIATLARAIYDHEDP